MQLPCLEMLANSRRLRSQRRILEEDRVLHVLIAPVKAAAPPEPVMKENKHNHGIATDPTPAAYAEFHQHITKQVFEFGTSIQAKVAPTQHQTAEQFPWSCASRVDKQSDGNP